jgi:hypothetical protein
MKKSLFYASLLAAVLMVVSSCHRNYKVNYARVPVDTMAHNDFAEVEPDNSWEEEPLVETSELGNKDLRVNDPNRKKAMKDMEEYMSGKGLPEN